VCADMYHSYVSMLDTVCKDIVYIIANIKYVYM